MFLKSLTIYSPVETIREIKFHKGINLIVDESEGQITGNSVGKTTVLKLIDFCLGGKPKNIYEDPETKKEIYKLVKDYLVENKIIISLCLTENLDNEDADKITIDRNFLARSKIIRRINGKDYTEDEFELKLKSLIFPDHEAEKPTFRQIISHNIRIKDLSINNTLKTLDKYTADSEYETLHLYLLGCDVEQGQNKQEILQKIKQEETFQKRLEKHQTKSAYEAALSLVESGIEDLNVRKSNFNINENFEIDLNELNKLKYNINLLSSTNSNLNIRKDLILEAEKELSSSKSDIDLSQLKAIYDQANSNMGSIQKSFEDMLNYHNKMIEEKVSYISKELPTLTGEINENSRSLKLLLKEEAELSSVISKSDSFGELELLIGEINEKYKDKGEYESIIEQLEEVERNINSLNTRLNSIDDKLFSEDFEDTVKVQINKFNKHFAATSSLLYDEKYALKYDKKVNKKRQQFYKFSAFNTNFSSGKKQGEISCFDIAYTLFADEENMHCLHFLLNDKKELMHDNQLVKIADLANKNNIQFVASILKDKLPEALNNEIYFIVKLSEDDKLFRIE